MNIIVFDLLCAQPFGNVKFHGGGEYTKTVFKALLDYADTDFAIEVCYNTDEYIDDWIKTIINEKNLLVHSVKDENDIAKVLKEAVGKGNVRFFTGMIYLYKHGKVDFPKEITSIGTCHGLRTLEKPYDKYCCFYGDFKGRVKNILRSTLFRKYLYNKHKNDYERAIENFDIIATVSKHSEYAIKIFLSQTIKNAQIKVLYSPITYHPKSSQNEKISEKFIMMISADRWEKNSYRGVSALDNLYGKDYLKNIKTYVYGNYPSGLKRKLKNPDNFRFFGYVDSNELEKAYQSCELFFYPTLNEGFGLPPLEAMQYGKTCVISAVCSLTEVYGDAVYYFNPYDIQEIENRILLASEKKISESIIRGKYDYISELQNRDLNELCRLICGD